MRGMTILAVAVSLVTVLCWRTYAADTVTVKGEVVDTYCYAFMDAKGESHRACGLECFAKGIPVALLENKTNKLYVLLPNKDKAPVPKEVIDRMGRQATVTGTLAVIGGSQFLTVESVK